MKDINQVTLVGRLTRDMEMKYTASGTAVGRMAIAVNRRVKKGDEWTDDASFIDLTLWGKQAESLSQYLVKGQQVAVAGELVQERWEQDGQKRSRVGVNVQDIQLLGKPGWSSGQAQGTGSQSQPAPRQDDYSAQAYDDDIPF